MRSMALWGCLLLSGCTLSLSDSQPVEAARSLIDARVADAGWWLCEAQTLGSYQRMCAAQGEACDGLDQFCRHRQPAWRDVPRSE